MKLPYILLPGAASISLVSAVSLPLHRREIPNPAPIQQVQNGVTFYADVEVNGQTFQLVPDTGSSDLWVPVENFTCVNHTTALVVPQENCAFSQTYKVPDSMEYVANQTFGVQYGTGIALGKVGYANVSINGIGLSHAKVGLVDRTDEHGAGYGSGILGLGFPPVTSAHPGTELDNQTLLYNRAVYDPVFVQMYKQDLVEPWYSFAIERPPKDSSRGPGGWLGLGELPPVSHSDDWAVKPIEITESLPDELTDGKREITLMTLTVDGVSWGNGSSRTTNSTKFQAVVDTGNHMNLVPQPIAESINNAFDPPGVFDQKEEVYIVDCNSTTPELGITLDGHTFWHKTPDDLIFHDVRGFCFSSVAPTGSKGGLGLNFLGDAFLRNVVSVYDFEKTEMRFAARTEDGDSSPPPTFTGAATALGISAWYFTVFALTVTLLR